MIDSSVPVYPWYGLVSGPELQQGDILLSCPAFLIPPEAAKSQGTFSVKVESCHAVVISQSCDLAVRADGTSQVDEVMLCPVYFKTELADNKTFRKNEAWNDAIKGKFVGYHVLNRSDLSGHELDFMMVDLRRAYSLSIGLVRQTATDQSPRVRLPPPYREHLSQAFARFFMRVGLPSDIPLFK